MDGWNNQRRIINFCSNIDLSTFWNYLQINKSFQEDENSNFYFIFSLLCPLNLQLIFSCLAEVEFWWFFKEIQSLPGNTRFLTLVSSVGCPSSHLPIPLSARRALPHRAVWGLQLLRPERGDLRGLSLPAEPRPLQELHQLSQGLRGRSVSLTHRNT